MRWADMAWAETVRTVLQWAVMCKYQQTARVWKPRHYIYIVGFKRSAVSPAAINGE